jgi:putative transposase
VGKLELRIPQDRQGHFSTQIFERYQRSEKALVSALAEMYIQGVSILLPYGLRHKAKRV